MGRREPACESNEIFRRVSLAAGRTLFKTTTQRKRSQGARRRIATFATCRSRRPNSTSFVLVVSKSSSSKLEPPLIGPQAGDERGHRQRQMRQEDE